MTTDLLWKSIWESVETFGTDQMLFDLVPMSLLNEHDNLII